MYIGATTMLANVNSGIFCYFQFPGCQEACRFHAEASTRAQQSQPVIHTKGEGVVRVSGALARWPPPTTQPGAPLVYVVMRRSANGPWRQIIQTIDLATRVPANNGGALLRVLVVDPQGLVTIYSPDESYNKQDLSLKKKKKINTEIRATTPESMMTDPVDQLWTLKEVSLIHQKVLVIGEIAWEPRTSKGVYLVTWEVDGGGLKGNLFTDSTCVTLSLWPDTIYHIQVELVSRRPGIDNEKSEMMTLDTGRALKVSTESMEDVKILPDSNKRSTEDQAESVDHLYSVFVSSMRGEHISNGRQNMELVLGCTTAVVMFVAMLVILIWRFKRQGTFPGTNVYVGDSSIRSKKLVEDFLPVHGFQPILTMVSDDPMKSRGVCSASTSPAHPARQERRPEVQV